MNAPVGAELGRVIRRLGRRDVLPAYHERLRGIAFWLAPLEHATPIRVIITLQALAVLSQRRDYDDIAAAFNDFQEFQARIEVAAMTKYEKIRPRIELFEGAPTFLLMTGDHV